MSLYSLNQDESSIWNMKYRPKTIDECVLPQHTKDQFNGMLEQKRIPNLLLASPTAGTGKSTSAMALCRALGYDVLFINASLENSVDDIRNTIVGFCSSMSLDGNPKGVLLDECLHEDEPVRVGTVDDWKSVALKDLKFGEEYPVVSFNVKTGEFENDVGTIISDKQDDLYEVTLATGETVKLNAKHPFIVRTADGKYIEKTIESGLSVGDEIVMMR